MTKWTTEPRRPVRGIMAVCVAASVAACSLLPAPPPEIRWFSAAPAAPVASPGARDAAPRSLRLRRVTAARHLGERIAWRAGAEVGFRELERWAELPEAVVARALERALFESGRFVRDGRAELALDIDVRSFEELRGTPPVARVELGVLLAGGGERALLDRPVLVEVGADGADGAALAEAMAQAVAGAIEAVTEALAAVSAPAGE